MNRKNTIRLTESELKRVITESVKKVLREGSTVNNQELPDFKKGKYACASGIEQAFQYFNNALKTRNDIPEDIRVELEKLLVTLKREINGVAVHNQRASEKYFNGQPQFGRDWETSEFVNKQKGREADLSWKRNQRHPDDVKWDEFMSAKTWR
jgi:hypothetical protein